VTLNRRSTLANVAAAVSHALKAAEVEAVLTGGAAAAIYSGGAYTSYDLDFVVRRRGSRRVVDDALGTLGFARDGSRYIHPATPFFVEFVAGPLAVGGELDIRPVTTSLPGGSALMLSPTDACRDRLAAFYHWSDRQSLDVALEIARRHAIDLPRVRRWSQREGHTAKFDEFRQRLNRRPGT
jgi:hypothetical protein